MVESSGCHDVRDLIPEIAMGVASGEDRAKALAHIARCPQCRAELAEVAAVVDDLLLLTPEHEPPAGFDARVLSELDGRRPNRWRRTLLAAAAVVLAAAAAGTFTWRVGADDRDLAAQYRDTLEVADGRYLTAAELRAGDSEAGHVFAYQGSPSWLFVSVEDGVSGAHDVRVVTTDARTLTVGTCIVRDGQGSWGVTIDLPVREIARVELAQGGQPTMVARLQ